MEIENRVIRNPRNAIFETPYSTIFILFHWEDNFMNISRTNYLKCM